MGKIYIIGIGLRMRLMMDLTDLTLFGQMVDYAWGVIPHLRIDTHENNAVMQHLVEKHGFQRCGIIHLEDGAPRIAFERV